MRSQILPLLLLAVPACLEGEPSAPGDEVAEQDSTVCGVLEAGASPEAVLAVHHACQQLGVPYAWAGGHGSRPGPSRGVCDASNGAPNDCHVIGLDCSGLARYVYDLAVGRDIIPGTAAAQYASARAVRRFHRDDGKAVLEAGDLVFFGGSAPSIHHVAVYLGADKIVEAPFSGGHVRVHDLSAYSDYYGAIRLYKDRPDGGGSAVIDRNGAYHVFTVGQGGRVKHAGYANGAWRWQDLGGNVDGNPAVTYNPSNHRFDVFATNPSGHLIQRTYLGGWGKWHTIGGSLLGPGASAVLDKAGAYHVFTVDTLGVLHEATHNASGWHWHRLGGTITSTPAVVYEPASHRFDVFGTSPNGHLYHKAYTGTWSKWHLVGGSGLRSGASAVIDKHGFFHVFAINHAGVLVEATRSAGAWHWHKLGGTVAGTPGATYTAGTNRFDVFATSPKGHLYQKRYTGTWSKWRLVGGAGLAAGLTGADESTAGDTDLVDDDPAFAGTALDDAALDTTVGDDAATETMFDTDEDLTDDATADAALEME